MLRFLILIFVLAVSLPLAGQSGESADAAEKEPTRDEKMIRQLFDNALTQSGCYEWLRHLCKEIGPRLSGSPQAAQSVEYVYEVMQELGLDRVEKQACMVPHWVRGKPESAWFKSSSGKTDVPVCALGGSIGTGKKGITAPVVEVFSLEEVREMDRKDVEGKIVFFNRPMEPKHLNTFHAYSGCVDQRGSGASEASRKGALAVVVRSMNLRDDDFPHTGNTRYADDVKPIPASAISTQGADKLHAALEQDPDLKFFLQMNCETLPDAPSHNVIGEIKGSEFPDEIIVIGGHLDSWDLGEGAQDDGTGVVQALEVLHLFKLMGYQPKRTVRAVAWMNEENGMRGALKYAEVARERGENHIAGLESDRGGLTPRGFTVDATDEVYNKVLGWKGLLEPYMLHDIIRGYGGVDISPFRKDGVPLFGFLPDSQRYFDYHHARTDVFEAVNKRELELGAASMAAFVYLISEYGL
jgi:carboxypeptidase Q